MHAPHAGLAVIAVAALAACGGGGGPAGSADKPGATGAGERAPLTSGGLRRAVRTPAIVDHLRRLERLARANDGHRAAGTPGGEASIDMVAGRLRDAGYRVRLQNVRFPFFDERSRPRVTAGARRLRAREDVATLIYSAGGRAEGPIERVRRLGCSPRDHARVGAGEIALIRRGTCTLRRKAALAEDAGASAVLIFNDGGPGRTGTIPGTLGRPGAGIPVVGTSVAAGRVLAAAGRASVVVDATAERRTTRNVIAETPAGRAAGTVMLGGHIDSVTQGPGINDNGSGVATLLEIAERLAELRAPRHRVRFAFWGAEELGLHGSRQYVRRLSRRERREITAYVNLDMTGSPNPARLLYDGDAGPRGSARVERALRAHFRASGLPTATTGMRGGSDHTPFLRAGIPVGGIFTGARATKTAAQARRFGGRAGRPLDRCYHRRCDTLANVDRRVLGQNADAAAHALVVLAR